MVPAAIEMLLGEVTNAVVAHRAEAHLDAVGGFLGKNGHFDSGHPEGLVDQPFGVPCPVVEAGHVLGGQGERRPSETRGAPPCVPQRQRRAACIRSIGCSPKMASCTAVWSRPRSIISAITRWVSEEPTGNESCPCRSSCPRTTGKRPRRRPRPGRRVRR